MPGAKATCAPERSPPLPDSPRYSGLAHLADYHINAVVPTIVCMIVLCLLRIPD